ncbi:MAG TPA: hypothetical protein DIS94_06955, partial [Bacteroidetes bacterium]|nr:hypothetical protein [Bacteroidota bacterium]
ALPISEFIEIQNNTDLNNFKSYIENKISKFNEYSIDNKNSIILEKILYDLTVYNYNPAIPNLKPRIISDNPESNIPQSFNLSQNFPNPFNPVTNISYRIPVDGMVSLKVYDILGKEVATLVSEVKQAGNYQVVFNGNNLASGIYFYRINVNSGNSQSGNFTQVKRMMLVK